MRDRNEPGKLSVPSFYALIVILTSFWVYGLVWAMLLGRTDDGMVTFARCTRVVVVQPISMPTFASEVVICQTGDTDLGNAF
jgi:hypothetical protein